jgi:pantoate--beta-alanine ligase
VVEATQSHLDATEVKTDYVELVDPGTFLPQRGSGDAILLVAAFVGTTRLIDNVRLSVGPGER